MKTTSDAEPVDSGARLVWQMLREEKNVFVTDAPDLVAVRANINRIFDEFERMLQRSLPRPTVVPGREEVENVSETIENDPFFQKLKRIDERRSSTTLPKIRTSVTEEHQRQWMNRVFKILERAPSCFILDVSGENGGRAGMPGNHGLIRANVKTLRDILDAVDPARAARTDLYRGRWLLIATPPFRDMNELVGEAVVFWETLAKSVADHEST